MTTAAYLEARPLRLFRRGKDTLEIAQLMGIAECEVERLIHIQRSHETRKKARFEKRI